MVRSGFVPLDIFVIGRYGHVIFVPRLSAVCGCVIHARYQLVDGVAVSVV